MYNCIYCLHSTLLYHTISVVNLKKIVCAMETNCYNLKIKTMLLYCKNEAKTKNQRDVHQIKPKSFLDYKLIFKQL